MLLSNNEFSQNLALLGACIYYIEFFQSTRQLQIQNNKFSSNQAEIEGGAIKYIMKRPKIDQKSNVFDKNSALYGDDIASYPLRIKLTDDSLGNYIKLTGVLTANKTMVFMVLDFDNQFCQNYEG